MKTKLILSYIIITFITIVLLDFLSFALFFHFTNKSFSYSSIAEERLKRIINIKTKIQNNQDSKTFHIFHPYLGYVGRPGIYQFGEKHPWGPYNEYGMHSVNGLPYPYNKKGDEFVVAVLGGSVAEIFANITATTLNNYMRTDLGFDRNIVMIGLACGGYKQPQQLFHLQYALLSGFEFDAVLNIDGFNDLVFVNANLNDNINPIFPSGRHFSLMSKFKQQGILDKKTLKLFITHYNLYETEAKLLSFIQNSYFKYSVFFNLLGELWSEHTRKKSEEVKYRLGNEAKKTITTEFRGPPFSIDKSNYEIAADIWQQSSEMLYAVCQANSLVYIHVLQPNQYVEGSKNLSEKEKEVAIDVNYTEGIAAKEGYKYLILKGKQLKAQGLPFYDFTMVFKDVKEDIYVDDCCHFNMYGNVIMAKKIAHILMDKIKECALSL
jgi:hypothetical protein